MKAVFAGRMARSDRQVSLHLTLARTPVSGGARARQALWGAEMADRDSEAESRSARSGWKPHVNVRSASEAEPSTSDLHVNLRSTALVANTNAAE
jgi:hypothetical protein